MDNDDTVDERGGRARWQFIGCSQMISRAFFSDSNQHNNTHTGIIICVPNKRAQPTQVSGIHPYKRREKSTITIPQCFRLPPLPRTPPMCWPNNRRREQRGDAETFQDDQTVFFLLSSSSFWFVEHLCIQVYIYVYVLYTFFAYMCVYISRYTKKKIIS